MIRFVKHVVVLVAVLLLASPVTSTRSFAVSPLPDVLSNPEHEARARELSKKLRCVVCQNQSINDSNAPLAKDLRVLVRERITAGDSNEEALDFIVARYGNFVLLKPPVQANTMLLWLAPLLLFLLAGRIMIRSLAGSNENEPNAEPLSEGEQRRLTQLLQNGERP